MLWSRREFEKVHNRTGKIAQTYELKSNLFYFRSKDIRFLRKSSNLNIFISPRISKIKKNRKKIEVIGISEKGSITIKPNKPNQDRYFIHEYEDKQSILMGIFDGHGKYGHLIAEFV